RLAEQLAEPVRDLIGGVARAGRAPAEYGDSLDHGKGTFLLPGWGNAATLPQNCRFGKGRRGRPVRQRYAQPSRQHSAREFILGLQGSFAATKSPTGDCQRCALVRL